MKTPYILSFLFLTLLFSSCNKDEEKELNDDINGVIVTDASLLQELIASPENLSIANKHYFLSTYLQRDFMPVSEEDGRPMACVNTLTEEDNLTITDDIELKKQYVIKGDEIWIATYSEIRTPYDFVVEGVVRNGPKWEPGILVDVVSEFVVNGTTYRILAKSQKINRTDWTTVKCLGRKTKLIEVGKDAISIPLEKNYFIHLHDYYANLKKLGIEYENLDYRQSLDFFANDGIEFGKYY